jgi:hypothetical protein
MDECPERDTGSLLPIDAFLCLSSTHSGDLTVLRCQIVDLEMTQARTSKG